MNKATVLTVAGQLIGVVGLLIQWQAAPQLFGGFPPGIVYVAGAAAIVLLDRRSPWSPASAILLSAFIAIGGLAGGDTSRNLAMGNLELTIGMGVLYAGLALSVIAGVVAIIVGRRGAARQPAPYSRENPRRTITLIAVGGMFLAGISDAAPEGLHWDGPGPVMFLILGLLTLFVPGRHIAMLSALLSAAFIYGAFDNMATDHLTTPTDTVPFVFAYLQLLGYTVATVAAAISCLPSGINVSRQRPPTRSIRSDR
ncbi:MAG TPA: hypothetical protein VJ914_06265 [Pseudonocardiaceae bacterium]|nr:hypothetical protein [Pseudonocardiaceae bacterium]